MRRIARQRIVTRTIGLLAMAATLAVPAVGRAFCGFYVSGAQAELYNNASIVVMMREGTRTVLSMQNNYEGPPENFAMVVPVPVVLHEENVKTLPNDIFERVDRLAAPRLVEYWEVDPCYVPPPQRRYRDRLEESAIPTEAGIGSVVIEAQFTVGEYEIVILSADDSMALDTWLRENEYRIPEGAEPILRPYVASGMKFFVARVNVEEVRFENGQAMLSPLRFHYDAEAFSLPVRLGLLNAHGHQDLLVHILAQGQRYEAANYPNVTIPTNLDVSDATRERFGEFYAALFDKTLEVNPGAVVTEYSWDASTCDPCPGPTLTEADLMTLGADVVPSAQTRGYVLTRLHARYTVESLGEDLIFRAAPPIAGGREWITADGHLEHGSQASSVNNFQGRYAIRHPWEGPIACENPVRGRWGGPPAGVTAGGTEAAQDLAFAPRGGLELADFVRQDVPELGVSAHSTGN